MDDVLQPILHFLDRKKIHKYTSTTPTMGDNYLNYVDGRNAINNPNGAYNNAEKESDYHARGSYPLISMNQVGYVAGFNTIYQGPENGSADLYVQVKVTEPFMMSPFIYAHEKQNSQGFYGIHLP